MKTIDSFESSNMKDKVNNETNYFLDLNRIAYNVLVRHGSLKH